MQAQRAVCAVPAIFLAPRLDSKVEPDLILGFMKVLSLLTWALLTPQLKFQALVGNGPSFPRP